MTLAQLPEGQSGTVVQIQGGNVLAKRLEDMGIRQGKTITKQSAMMFHGPVTILVDRAQVALGYGMASAILLEVDATSFRIEKVEG
ncbi:MAG TPA: ferrous iron transport protein A [Dehalococcoidia bacterium]|nr:ferrous iron transport protein A [Dehalococcoidia bacterium]